MSSSMSGHEELEKYGNNAIGLSDTAQRYISGSHIKSRPS